MKLILNFPFKYKNDYHYNLILIYILINIDYIITYDDENKEEIVDPSTV